MITDNLFDQVLLDPSGETPGGRLLIVSGFATANMADRHMSALKKRGRNVAISLIVGMARAQGVEKTQHTAFKNLVTNAPYELDFECRYAYHGNPIHAKTYLWLDRYGGCKQAFCGSANYTLTGFGRGQIESMAPANPERVRAFYDRIRDSSASCLEDTIDEVVPLIRTTKPTEHNESVTLSLLVKSTGETHRAGGGLNWGQRLGRNPDQAYIHVPADIARSDFFPPIGEQFTVLSDDDFSFIFVRAQAGGKGLHTTFDNSEIGRYIRQRIGVASGEHVTRQHLLDYGRIDIGFTKIDNDTYLMDFRPNLEPGIIP